jgi:hypothetical protein
MVSFNRKHPPDILSRRKHLATCPLVLSRKEGLGFL